MDPRTIELLGSLGLLTEQQVAVLSDLAHAGRGDLDDVEQALVEAAESALGDNEFTDDRLTELEGVAAAVFAIREERERRPDPAVVRAELAARLRTTEAPSGRPRSPAVVRRPPGMTRRPQGAGASLVASSGRPLTDAEDLADEFGSRLRDVAASNATGRLRVATVTANYPEGRRLGLDPVVNGELIEAVTSPQAITASGGLCAPSGVRWTVPSLGTDARPVRDGALVGFQATRGGIRFVRPMTLGGAASGVDVWTATNDANPSDPATKPCLTLACATEVEVTVEAITRCIEVGNLRARFRPEQVRQAMEVVAHAHARLAEQELLTAMLAGSTAVTSGQLLGAARDVLATLDRVVASVRARHRLDRRSPMRFLAPSWLLDLIRSDMAREMPGATAERLATADAEVERWLAARAIVPTWSLDMGVSAFSAQGAGPLLGWPSTVQTLLYPEGSWLFLDGGALDLGIVRDSTLNATNDYQVFAETFEACALVGVESLALTMDLCPSGEASALVSVTPCTTGS